MIVRRLGTAFLAVLVFTACVPKKKFDAKAKETDACFAALQGDNTRKKELAKATAELQAKLAELSKALAENEGKNSDALEKLNKDLQAKADEVRVKLQAATDFENFRIIEDAVQHQNQSRVAAGKIFQHSKLTSIRLKRLFELRITVKGGALTKQFLHISER